MGATKDLGRKTLYLALLVLAVAAGSRAEAGQNGLIARLAQATSGTPAISGSPARQVIAGSAYSFQPTASDPNGDPLQFRVKNLPRWATFSTTTGRLSGTPALVDVGRYRDIRIFVSDGTSESALAFGIRVLAGSAPVIGGTPSTTATESAAYSFQASASDADQQVLTFAIVNKPSWASFNGKTGLLSGTPPAGSAATYSSIGLSVTDGASTVSLPVFSITVSAVKNHPPAISGTPATGVQVGKAYDFRPTATDADGDALRYYVVNRPAFLNFDTATGRLYGTPPTGSEATYADVLVSVGDGKDVTFLPSFTITVTPAPVASTTNTAPTISGTPATNVTTGQAYLFQPQASDPDPQVLAFGIANKPSWAAFDTTSGRLSGTPPSTAAGTYANVVISVSDGIVSATLPAFTITVVAANRTPTISGTPPTSVTTGQAYAFQPTAADADGQALAFGIANKPAWATFDTRTGRLAGTPSTSYVGTYSNIVISVSDGTLSATLPAFSVTVSAPVAQAANLTWTAPTLNSDGTPLTNLAGYKIRYGSSPAALTQVLDIPGAGVTSASIEGLSVGTWYFAISSYTNTGVESAPTATVSYTVR